tara:strand:+ start:304 stop:600 length:297 start_codon:yes stop_codon:yes gene_type:complete
MTENRGRPKENNKPLEGKYKRVYHDEDGTKMTWHYDTSRTTNGPVKVDISYPKGYDFRTFEEKLHDENKKVPLTKRKYLNPANDKLVGYARARALGII